MRKVFFVLVDAMRSDYISEGSTPFLYHCANQGTYYKEVSQSRSFCERSEIFTGMSSGKLGYFTALGYDPENSPFKKLRFTKLLFLIKKILPKNKIYQVYKHFLNQEMKKISNGMSTYEIPFNLLKYFNLTEDEFDFRSEKAFQGKDNIFKDCKNNNLNLFYDSFTALNFTSGDNDDSRLRLAKENTNKDFSLYMIYQSLLDQLGHKFGPESPELKNGLKEIDQKLELFAQEVTKEHKNATFIFLGDHGMSNVTNEVDVKTTVLEFAKKHQLKLEKDYIYFLDSTMLRIWYFSERARTLFENRFKEIGTMSNSGVFVDDTVANEEGIPFGNRKYGDLIWMANLGGLIFPDFFHNKVKNKGMHGYHIDHPSGKGTCIVYNPLVGSKSQIEHIKLTKVYDILKNELGIIR